jgi:hypothetical protein
MRAQLFLGQATGWVSGEAARKWVDIETRSAPNGISFGNVASIGMLRKRK